MESDEKARGERKRGSMRAREADELGRRIAGLIETGQLDAALAQLAPVLAERTRFALLDRIGATLGDSQTAATDAFLDRIASGRTEGGWVVIASALGQRLSEDPSGTFSRCRAFIVSADVWYGADIFGERVPGPALVADLHDHLPLLAFLEPVFGEWEMDAVKGVGWGLKTS